MLYLQKSEALPVTVEELVARSRAPRGKRMRGRSVWLREQSGEWKLLRFDDIVQDVVTPEEFRKRQDARRPKKRETIRGGTSGGILPSRYVSV